MLHGILLLQLKHSINESYLETQILILLSFIVSLFFHYYNFIFIFSVIIIFLYSYCYYYSYFYGTTR